MNTVLNILCFVFLSTTCYTSVGQTGNAVNFPIDSSVDAYFQLKDDVSKDNAAMASARAKKLVTIVQTYMSAEKNNQNNTSLSKVLAEAGFIASTQDINVQKIHFASLSADMYDLIKNTGVTGMPVVQYYCPMKKATWLSKSGDSRNPYFGDTMPTCGKVLLIIPAKKS